MISVKSFLFCPLPCCTLPTGVVVVSAKWGVEETLDAGVHVSLVIVAHIHHVMAALHGAGQGLESDVVGAAVAAEGDELIGLVDLTLALQYAVSGSTPPQVAAAFSKAVWM